MQKSILKFDKVSDNKFHTLFKNNHGRKIYLLIWRSDSEIKIQDCFYVDRPMRNRLKSIPRRFKTKCCNNVSLLEVISAELDKRFYDIAFSDEIIELSTEEYIKQKLSDKEKYKFLILVKKDDYINTRLKNRVHRSIYLEIKLCDGGKSIVQKCYYYDRRYKRNEILITPSGLSTIFFDFSMKQVLEIVNEELNCDFTDVIITDDTFGFKNNDIPICGSI